MPLNDDYSYDFGGKFPDEKNGGALNDALNGALNEEEIVLLELLCKQSSITQMEAAEKLGFSRRKIQRMIKGLTEEGYLRREGSRKKGFWVVGN